MDVQNKKEDYNKQLRELQTKYVYYFIGLNVAAIAYTVSITKDQILNCFHVLPAISIFLWGIAIFNSFKFLKIQLSSIASMIYYLDIRIDTENKRFKNEIDELMKSKNKSAVKLFKYKETFFI